MSQVAGPNRGLVLVPGALMLASGLATAAFADGSLRWRLSASVPVICAILDIRAPAGQPASLAITTTCNAERYRLVLRDESGEPALRAAQSSAGPAAISGGAVTITATQPGEAVTLIELAEPASTGQVSVTLQPI
jgi:hypothetical protein